MVVAQGGSRRLHRSHETLVVAASGVGQVAQGQHGLVGESLGLGSRLSEYKS